MDRRSGLGLLIVALALLTPSIARAQTTDFYLHSELPGDLCCYALKTNGPDVAAVTIAQSNELKNQPPQHTIFRSFKTLSTAPNWYGSIAAGSTVRFRLWMKKTASFGVVYPEATLRLNDIFGTLVCQATGVAAATPPNSPANQALTTTLTEYVFSCTTAAALNVTTSDRLVVGAGFFLATGPGNKSMKVEVHYEGSGASPVPNSRVVVPTPVAPTPTITSFNYSSAPPSTVVHITGTNFGDASVTRSVTFNGTTATTANWTATGVDATVPSGLAPGPSPNLVPVPVRVIVHGVQSAEFTFSINPPPTLTSLTPSTAHTTDVITIAGQNFLATQAQGSSTVTFNGVPASPSSWSTTSIQVPVPSGQTSGTVIVTVAQRSTVSGLPFMLIGPPAVSTLIPASGQVGALVTIVGQRFGATQGTNTIKFNGTTATPTFWSDSVIKAPVPAGATTGAVVVRVSNQPSPDATFTVLTAGSMSGAVTRVTGGTAIAGASVQAVLAGVVKGTATSAGDGTYSISSLDPGSYDVRVFKSGFSPELRTGNAVTASNSTTVNVTMYIPGSATGKVTQIDGITPLAGAAVTVYDGPIQKGATNTNATGDYTVANLRPGSFTVQAANVGYRTQDQSAAVTENAATTTNFSLDGAPAGPVLYAYDELGRLVQVTDPSGQSAIYRYDAVGNITAIERPGASVIAISDFTPNGGTIGAAVTIHGAGFSTTPSQNIVKFNGVTATVTSATATEIAVTVPTGATDGAITVTVGAVTGTSATAFDVTTSTAPTVTGFTPTAAASGTAVTVNGTNFDTTPANDNLRVNLSPQQVGSATATAIQATIAPSATTGRVTVATANGTGVSTDYLWIAPPPYPLADLGPTTAVTLDTDVAVTAPTTKFALLAFEATEGQRVAINATNVNGALGVTANVHLYTPFGAILKTQNVQTNAFLDTVTLRWTGTYTVVFDPLTSAAMSGTLRVITVPADITGPIAFGTPLPVTTNVAGQNARLTFTGTAGHRLSLNQAGFNCFTSTTSILAPNGTVVATSCGGNFIDTTAPLAATGTYTVLVDPKDAVTGSTTLTLYDVPADAGGTLVINDPATAVSFTPGQNGFYTFTGANAQSIKVILTGGISGTFPCVTMTLQRPDPVVPGNFIQLAQTSGCGGVDITHTLPANDTYRIKVDPIGNSAGSATLRVISPPSE